MANGSPESSDDLHYSVVASRVELIFKSLPVSIIQGTLWKET